MSKTIVVIGGGASAMMFSTQYKKLHKEDNVIVFEKTKYVAWAGCPTPYYIANELSFDHVVLRSPESFISKGIDVRVENEVTKVDFDGKYVVVKGEKIAYDKLVIASGAKARMDKGFTLNHAVDAEKIKGYIEKNHPKSAIIVGAGFVGIELAEALIKRGLKVTVVEKGDDVFPQISKDLKEELYKKIEDTGLDLRLNEDVSNIDTSVYDMYISAIGVTPNIDYLEGKLEIKDGKILVNEYFETSIKDVYAIGDSVYNRYIGEDIYQYSPQGDVANKHGFMLAHGRAFKGTFGSFASSYFDVRLAATGLNERRAKELGHNAKVVRMTAQTMNSGFEEYKPIKMEIVYDEDKKIILGAAAVGYESVAQFIDQVAIVIAQKTRIEDLINIDFCYSPTNSSVWNPLLLLYRKVEG